MIFVCDWFYFEKNNAPCLHRVLAARRQYAIRSVPNPLEFFGYVYCFSSILAGPAFEYTLYDNATSGEAYRKVSLVLPHSFLSSLSSSYVPVYTIAVYTRLIFVEFRAFFVIPDAFSLIVFVHFSCVFATGVAHFGIFLRLSTYTLCATTPPAGEQAYRKVSFVLPRSFLPALSSPYLHTVALYMYILYLLLSP